MKTKEELNAFKKELETLNKKLSELNEEELEQVIGGHDRDYYSKKIYDIEWDGSLTIDEKEALLRELRSEAADDPDLSNGMKYIIVDWITSLLGFDR